MTWEEGVGEVYTSEIKSKFLVSRLGQQMEKLFWDQIIGMEWKEKNDNILYIQIIVSQSRAKSGK